MTPILIRCAEPRNTPPQVAERLLPARLRGPAINVSGRAEARPREEFDDGWTPGEAPEPFAAEVVWERPKSLIASGDSPGSSVGRSIDPYRGCEPGCVYCFARPADGHIGPSYGFAFQPRLFAMEGAAQLLERELSSPAYWPAPIALGVGADPYQPIERQYGVTRSLLEVLCRARHPVSIITKSNLILRDLDILKAMGRGGLVKVFIAVTTLDRDIARKMEPNAPTPERRLGAIEALNDAGVLAGVLVGPIIPAINDAEIDAILTRAHAAGAREAGHAMLRLRLELRDLFRERLLAHYPEKLRRAIALLQSIDDDEDREPQTGRRSESAGVYAWMIRRRFETAVRRLGYRETPAPLRSDLFRRPAPGSRGEGAPIIVAAHRAEARIRRGRMADHAPGRL